MIIVSNHDFVRGPGKKTLLGYLAAYWEEHSQGNEIWIDWRRVAEGKAVLPSEAVYTAAAAEKMPADVKKSFDVRNLFSKVGSFIRKSDHSY